MRPIARHSARLAPSARAPRASSPLPQYNGYSNNLASTPAVNQQPRRPFHSSIARTSSSSDPRVPPNSIESAEETRRKEEQRRPAVEERREEPQRNPVVEEGAQEQNVQNEQPKSAFPVRNKAGASSRNRTLRQRRAAETLPQPPPMPHWFMSHNITLVEENEKEKVEDFAKEQDRRYGEVVRCVDRKTGHVLFTVPSFLLWPGSADARRRKDQMSAAARDGKVSRKEMHWPEKYDEVYGKEEGKEAPPEWTKYEMPPLDSFATDVQGPLFWIFLDAELGAHGALALSALNQASHAASRVDISLVCPDENSHEHMERMVNDLSQQTGADLVRLDALDFEELAGEYVGQGQDAPGSFSTMGYEIFDGFEAGGMVSKKPPRRDEEDEEMDEDEEDDESESAEGQSDSIPGFGGIGDLRKALHERRHDLAKALKGTGIAGFSIGVPKGMQIASGPNPASALAGMKSASSSEEYVSWDDARLAGLLNKVLDSAKDKRATPFPGAEFLEQWGNEADLSMDMRRYVGAVLLQANPRPWRSMVGAAIVREVGKNINEPTYPIEVESISRKSFKQEEAAAERRQRTLIHVRDLKDICNSRLGDTIIRRLVRIVQKRRQKGEDIFIVGTTVQSGFGSFASFPMETEEFPFRTITVPPYFEMDRAKNMEYMGKLKIEPWSTKSLSEPADTKIREINLRHIQSMVKRLVPGTEIDLRSNAARQQMSIKGTFELTEKVLNHDQVQRLVLSAIGLTKSHAKSDTIQPIHIALATVIAAKVGQFNRSWVPSEHKSTRRAVPPKPTASKPSGEPHKPEEQTPEPRSSVESVKGSCNQHETRLLGGVVDPQNIKTHFTDVHAPAETIEALKTLTSLSFLRPDAFKYGVLANDRLPGLLLYGPPGTGKTLLAKAVAKESSATVLEISGAQIYEKYVGEGEKMVRAVFSLAKKLSPCVVFLDEADAIFGSRSSQSSRNTHREIINQFLREWDGMDDRSVFIMVATNRPFDLDDAVLRRLPRRLLVDLPRKEDREGILGIHLKGEELAPEVKLGELAEQTPLYSGSDLKNLCVAAALACVREENELVAASKKAAAAVAPAEEASGEKTEAGGSTEQPPEAKASSESTDATPETKKDEGGYVLPAKRILQPRHFERAIAEISASISEDMPTLTAIRKFDEQYGDRKGRKKKSGLGFGGSGEEEKVDESAVWVRAEERGGK